MDNLEVELKGGDTIQIKLFIESEKFRRKLLKAIEEGGISVFSPEWGHYPIKKIG